MRRMPKNIKELSKLYAEFDASMMALNIVTTFIPVLIDLNMQIYKNSLEIKDTEFKQKEAERQYQFYKRLNGLRGR